MRECESVPFGPAQALTLSLSKGEFVEARRSIPACFALKSPPALSDKWRMR
jgi:hypothetical protein